MSEAVATSVAPLAPVTVFSTSTSPAPVAVTSTTPIVPTPTTTVAPTTPTTTVPVVTPTPTPTTTTAPSVTTPTTTPSATTPTTFSQVTVSSVVSTPSPSAITQTVTPSNTNLPPTTIILTSTQPPTTIPVVSGGGTTTTGASSSNTSNPALATQSGSSSGSGGLSSGGKIAVAVVVPVVSVALIVLALLFLWRRRKQQENAKELRRKEVEEYGFNPNNDPTIPAVGVSSPNGDAQEMGESEGAGYRGWGATSSARKPSTNISSGNGPVGVAYSEPGNQASELASEPDHGPVSPGISQTTDNDHVGALGAGPATGDREIHRGVSNASSRYSAAARSDGSGDAPIPVGSHGADGAYYDDANYHAGPYGDGSYASGQPVIRDVSARRNTQIQNSGVVPQQGNAGIAQNF